VASPRKTRMTPQRRVILEEIEKSKSHPGADEIYEMVRRRIPNISLGTVYRNLEILSESGLVQKIDLGDGHRRFDHNLENHYHVRCTCCGRINDLYMNQPCDFEDMICRQTGYEIAGHRLDFFGLCPICKRQREAQHGLAHRQDGVNGAQETETGGR
jgi:Fe2+ or Zn2+ uptake regulation protein